LRACKRNILAALGLAGLLAGCSASSVVAQLPGDAGLPADAPARPVVPYQYPAVHDMPPPRPTKPLTDQQQQNLENELINLRNRQEGQAPAAKHAHPAKKAASKAKKRPPADAGQADSVKAGANAGAKTNP
jgi:hypothetical protein